MQKNRWRSFARILSVALCLVLIGAAMAGCGNHESPDSSDEFEYSTVLRPVDRENSTGESTAGDADGESQSSGNTSSGKTTPATKTHPPETQTAAKIWTT